MFIVEKYKGKYAILDTQTNVWYFAKGKKNCLAQAAELNKIIKGGLNGKNDFYKMA